MKLNKNILTIISIFLLSFILIVLSGNDKGRTAFVAIPAIFLSNVIFIIYGIIKKNQKLVLIALVLLFVAPIFAFAVFVHNFPFLTR